MKKIEKEEIIAEFKRVFELNKNKVPTIKEWNNLANISLDTVIRCFGKWKDAWKDAGYDVSKEEAVYKIKERIVIDIQKVFINFKNNNIDFKIDDLIRQSGHTRPTIMKYFGSVAHLLETAKIDINKRISKESLVEDFVNLYNKLGRIPTSKDINKYCKYSEFTFRSRFKSMDNIISAAGLQKPELKIRISEQELLDELKLVSEKLGRTPTVEDIHVNSKFGVGSYSQMFGSYTNALKKIGLTPNVGIKIKQQCPYCNIKTFSLISHVNKDHSNENKVQENLIVKLFKDGMTARDIIAQNEIFIKSYTSIMKVVRKYIPKEELEKLRVQKIKKTLKADYASGKYDWVNDMNRVRSATEESKQKNSQGLKDAYANGTREAWNKGETKETNPIIAKQAESVKETLKERFKTGEIEKKIGPESSGWNENRDSVARRYRLGLGFSFEERGLIKKRADYKCEKCGISQEKLEENGETLECDHITPLFKNGSNSWETNAQALCPTCHKVKSNEEMK